MPERFLEVPSFPQSLIIIKMMHDVDHPGINTTINKIRQTYYWPGVSNEVKQYVSYSNNII